MSIKIIIIGSKEIDKLSIAESLVDKNDNLSIGSVFSSDPSLKEVTNSTNYIYYMPNEEIHLAFKNNALLYINTDTYISKGITLDSFYNNDVFIMDLEDFNNISEHNIVGKDILVLWLDTKKYTDKAQQVKDIAECRYVEERLSTMPYMYFLDATTDEISDIVNVYLEGDSTTKLALLAENN